ncbi:hypothetical protein MRB53_030415 [Persea americana]|uniref:Uncharacterized protein n=1 Tax=Persea americana TaxID=3435 RepID=A0ACC2KL82_PERAE|nr:hypothetical protein MRB53_030415 [Persea americana]
MEQDRRQQSSCPSFWFYNLHWLAVASSSRVTRRQEGSGGNPHSSLMALFIGFLLHWRREVPARFVARPETTNRALVPLFLGKTVYLFFGDKHKKPGFLSSFIGNNSSTVKSDFNVLEYEKIPADHFGM